MDSSVVQKILSVFLMLGITGALVLSVMSKVGMDKIYTYSAGAAVFSLAILVVAYFVAEDRFSIVSRYRNEYSKTGTAEEFIRSYSFSKRIKYLFIVGLVVLTAILVGFSLSAGIDGLSAWHAYSIVFDHMEGKTFEYGSDDWFHDILIWRSQLPRTIVAIIAGSALAIGGAIMQSVVKNPLADPYTTGISSGAVLGATLVIVLGIRVSGLGQYSLVLSAFVFSLIPAGIMISVSRISNNSPATIILVGTAVSYIFSAFSTLIMMIADEQAMKDAFVWQVGSLSGTSWSYIPLMLGVTVVGSVLLYFTSGKLNLLMMGDDDAKSLGLNVENYRMLCLILLSLMTASVVSYIGIIGFLGLIAPHIARIVLGSDIRLILPASATLGAALMLLADVISRIIAIGDMPVGVVLSFIGGPIFLLLVLRFRREAWQQ